MVDYNHCVNKCCRRCFVHSSALRSSQLRITINGPYASDLEVLCWPECSFCIPRYLRKHGISR